MRLILLGCGTSSGVPRIGNDWGQCDPAEPRNRRTRVSIIVETETTRVLVDTGPDMREQLLAADIATVDAIIWTHDHADHCHGIDDVRQLFHASGRPIRGLARQATLDTLHDRFRYAVEGRNGYPATIAAEVLADEVHVGDLQIEVVDQPHGSITSAGLRFTHGQRSIVYATDFNELTSSMRDLYSGADVLVIDALRRAPHPTHPTLDQALRWSAELRAGRSILTHMDQSMDYRSLCATLPTGVEPGYDGMVVTL
ncbi:phosphoribosyl 1,2-cyclic phosphate phosphodiesterase [Sphingomonas guangdongensis]|uniref:Phosphoribosyl 1,2-cyclic phosphate phosphodiesterase n=1 Tax=Sphingomonas guangdongensis TaxID=1141890 RepID=A0A285R159_9SPHN|nr:MBL fold metallo-hydrolase [Sphingomonas guangdongensis]SOB87855.1 phosphoribosyl 1,2-cyclic phosphate phosphodiesterase [Sphingomonas guangdongensis]